MSSSATTQNPSKGRSIATLVIKIFLSLAFLAAAGAKLAGIPMMVQIFQTIGLGQWFRIVTALVEITGVIALWVPGYTVLGALWLGATMFFAILTHLFVLHSNPAPAVVLFVLNAVMVWLNSAQIKTIKAKFA